MIDQKDKLSSISTAPTLKNIFWKSCAFSAPLSQVHKSGPEKAERECLADVQTQTYAKFFGDAFAQSFPDAPIQFLDSWQVDLQGCPICRHATLEPYLDGKYEKYTNNCGFIADGAKLAAAFSHFTYCHSGQHVQNLKYVSGRGCPEVLR